LRTSTTHKSFFDHGETGNKVSRLSKAGHTIARQTKAASATTTTTTTTTTTRQRSAEQF
jgi:hypothetical protein